MLRASVVILVVACAVAASAWERYALVSPAEAEYYQWGGLRQGARFSSHGFTKSPFTLPTPQVVVAHKTCESSECPDEPGELVVICDNSCFRDNVVHAPYGYEGPNPCKPPRWRCRVGDDGTPRTRMLEITDSNVICEDGDGRASVNTGQRYLPGSCFVKVSLLDHTMTSEPVKKANPLLLTTLEEDRAQVEL